MRENPKLSIFESGKDINITSKDINPNFQLFIVYNPFNKGSKIIDPALFNKCVSFTLPQIDESIVNSATIINNSIKILEKVDRKIWNQIKL